MSNYNPQERPQLTQDQVEGTWVMFYIFTGFVFLGWLLGSGVLNVA